MNNSDSSFPILARIESPDDLRELDEDELPELASELRDFLLQSLSKTGGHLASGLGSVEITIALHYLFDTPKDRLIWDVGHQCYPHKILTGRRDQMAGLRQKGGLSGFPKITESEYDHFGAGHSSTSISAALGMAIAAKSQGLDNKTVAIIGDGGMTAGMAYEALNHGGAIDTDLLVILNDNEMSISPNVGAMSKYLSSIWSGKIYSSLRSGSKKVLKRIPSAWELARRAEEHVKGMVTPGTLFEELGFSYFGPIDGHNLADLLSLIRNLQKLSGPRMLHIVTRKGKGYAPAEADACKFHGVGPFDPETGIVKPSGKTGMQSYTNIFSDWLVAKGQQDSRLHAITPAMREGSGLVRFSAELPERYHDVGIAEQHSVTLAAGMACEGLKPVVAIYSTFLQRAYDQFIHDVAVQNLDVTFAIDRAGIVGADGATHTGNFDIAFSRCIPNVILMAPADGEEMFSLLNTAYQYPGPAMVRYPRDSVAQPATVNIDDCVEIGRALQTRKGKRAALLVFGSLYNLAMPIAEELDLSLVNMRFIKPLDEGLITTLAADHDYLITLEDASIVGGAGSAVLEYLSDQGIRTALLRLGLDDYFPSQGSREQVLEEYGLDPVSIRKTIADFIRP
ncbi:MAG: 1-deoxy-D-xylulose-5-phosphate synthase [Gammaproteobacteria bacterium]|jgi:1-deoxy-D-xylulose-5-phosphate synthase|nr:1-deoxy-D-xylulose-5-phosphate synthase [Gammaproteobacteria bacterium]